MKIFKNPLSYILLISILIGGCKELPLVKNEDQPSINAGSDIKNSTIWAYLQADHTKDLTNIDLFCRAVKHAGLEDILNGKEEYTVIISNNEAIAEMLQTLGGQYATVEDIPKVVLRNLLSDNIIKGRIRSFDLGEGENRKIETINGDYLWMLREVGTSDQYRLYINNDPSLIVSIPKVRSQNLDFLNGTAHVVERFTYYRVKTPAPDVIDYSKITIQRQIVKVTKDVYLRGGAYATTNFNDPAEIFFKTASDEEGTRRGLLQFPVITPAFGRIGAAKLYTYFFNTTQTINNPSINLGVDQDWNEATINYNTAPAMGGMLSSISFNRSLIPTYLPFDISAAYIQKVEQGKTFINLGISHPTNPNLKIRPKEYLNGVNAAYIELTSPPETILIAGNKKDLNVPKANGFYLLKVSDLSMSGTTDNNIFYSVKKAPVNGYLLKYGEPLKDGAEFTQADIVNGGIRYIYGGSGATDLLVLEPKDFQGGYFPQLININVAIL